MSTIKQEVAKRLDDYAVAFLTLEPEKTLPFFNIPMVFISDRGVDDFNNEHDILQFLKLYVMVLKKLEYARVELPDRKVIVLNENHAVTTFKVVRYGASGNILGQFNATYAFRKEEGHWRIVTAILLEQKEGDEATQRQLKKTRMEKGTYSELDENWPVTDPKTGFAADLFEYLLRKRTDAFFWFLRRYKPILVLGKDGPAVVTRFRDVQEVLNRPEVFQVTYRPMMDPSVGPFMLGRDATVYNQRDKGIMRSLIQQRDLPDVRKMVGRLAERCIDEGYADGQLEVVSQFSRKAPILLTGEYFGFPGPDLPTMMKWGKDTQYDMFHNTKMIGKVHDDNIRAGRFMHHYLKTELLPQRRRELKENPDLDDIVSRMLKLETPEEIGFNEERMLSNIMGMLVGHIETTSAAVVQTLDQLLSRPEALEGAKAAALAGDDQLLYRYCWEALRFNPINPIVLRLCVEDYRVASGAWRTTVIKGGTVVLVATRSAMKDEREVERPRKFRLDRPDHHYMHLGYGMHRCLGDHVSKVQVPELIKSLILKPNLRRVSEIDYADGPFPERFVIAFDA